MIPKTDEDVDKANAELADQPEPTPGESILFDMGLSWESIPADAWVMKANSVMDSPSGVKLDKKHKPVSQDEAVLASRGVKFEDLAARLNDEEEATK